MGDPAQSFAPDRFLEVLLREKHPGSKFEVINVAFTAINSHLTADEVAYIVDDCDARVLVTSADKATVARAAVADCPKVMQVLVFDEGLDRARLGDRLVSYEDTIAPFPNIVPGCQSVPFLGVQGFMVTKFSTVHGTESAAKDLVAGYLTRADSQAALAAANGRFPANTDAGKLVTDPVLRLFGKASVGGVPMPNIPQMSSVWSELGGAWVKATKGADATPAKKSFISAQRNIANKIG